METQRSNTACPVCASTDVSLLWEVKDHAVSEENFTLWECNHCTLRYTHPAPDVAAIGRYYQSDNYISHQSKAKGLLQQLYLLARNFTLRQKKALVCSATGKAVGALLDIGTGVGAFMHTMNKAGWLCTGVEASEQARMTAISMYNVDVFPAEHFYMLPETNYDAITMWHVLEHVHDLHGYMQQIRKLLAPKGKLIVAVPNYTSYDARYYGRDWAAYDVPRHLYHFSPASMEALVSRHNMAIKKVKPMWLDSFYISLLSEQYKKGFLPRAFGIAAISNLKAFLNVRKCSSVIYIIEAK